MARHFSASLRVYFALLAAIRSQGIHLPSQTVLIDVLGLTVIGDQGPFRNVSTVLNPTNVTPPFFQVWDTRFLDILGSSPSVRVIAERDDFSFAFEAPIWNPASDQVFFASNNADPINNNNQINVINLKDVKGKKPQNITFTKVPINPPIHMVGGGTPYKNNLLFFTSGRGDIPPGLSLVNPNPPFNSTTILDNVHGRQFNSLNDGKVHPRSGAIFFTDVSYGSLLGYRPPPLLPNQVYRFDPKTGQLRVIADGFDKSNGIAFSPDGSVAYVVDSGTYSIVNGGLDSTRPATIYAFDVDEDTQTFTNRRVLAWADTGSPDGIQVDSKGNIYASCADGVHVFDSSGVLLGKIIIGVTANHVFAGKGRLVILGGTKVFLVEFEAGPSIVELQ